MVEPDVSVIVLAFGEEPLLHECIQSVLASSDDAGRALSLEVVVIDNGAPAAIAALQPDTRLRLFTMARNTGFAGGCNEGAARARGSTLVFLNSDATVEPSAVWHLTRALDVPSVGIVCGSVRLMDDPKRINSAGNPTHFLGLAWSGGYGDLASKYDQPRDITVASGALMALRNATWHDLGGFDATYFAYHEDVELSLRCWQRGLRVRYCPEAVALHDYDFTRHPFKHYLLERNRLLAVATIFPLPLLLAVVPALVVFEAAILVVAASQGWLKAKLSGYLWLLAHRQAIRRRRGQIQHESVISAADFARLLCPRIEPAVMGHIPGLMTANAALASYWWLVCRTLNRGRLSGG
jgi:GT2 family glycosyltransferase